MKPIIGIVEWPYTDRDGDKIFEVFTPIVNKINEHGGIPVGIFPTVSADFYSREIRGLESSEKSDLRRILGMCDAVIKPGAVRIYDYERLIHDFTVCEDVPYLGICAGMQLMAHHGKYKIEGNVRNDSPIAHHSKEIYAHSISIAHGSLLFDILGKDTILVNSKHNFHISDCGNLNVSATAPDGYIEAIENPNRRFQLGLQWHPELIDDENSDKIFDAFIKHAKEYKLR